jgi:hypothetical protein
VRKVSCGNASHNPNRIAISTANHHLRFIVCCQQFAKTQAKPKGLALELNNLPLPFLSRTGAGMFDANSSQPINLANFDFLTSFLSPPPMSEPAYLPQPTQDADLLQQLNFIPGLREILMLRQVHALEHATVWILSNLTPIADQSDGTNQSTDDGLLGGMSTDRGFYIYGRVGTTELQRAVHVALRRITSGDWDLAVHPRCGTNLSVGMLLTAGLSLGSFLLLPKGPVEQLVGLGLAATTAAYMAPDLGGIVQRYVTTAIPFNLAIDGIVSMGDHAGRPTHFIRVRWIE